MPSNVVAEARVGELVETLWDNRTEQVDPLAVRVYLEALRVLRRAPHAEAMLSGDASEQEAFGWQMSRLTALEPALTDFLQEAPSLLCQRLPEASVEEQRDILLALIELRAEAGEAVLPLLATPHYPHAELLWKSSTGRRIRASLPLLRDWVLERMPMVRRASAPPWPRRRAVSIPSDLPYRAILRTLRGHPVLRRPKRSCSWPLAIGIRLFVSVAVGSLGWWEPLQRHEVLLTLQDARRDPNPEVRQAARAALARLRRASCLQWFRQTLTSEDPQRVHDTDSDRAREN